MLIITYLLIIIIGYLTKNVPYWVWCGNCFEKEFAKSSIPAARISMSRNEQRVILAKSSKPKYIIYLSKFWNDFIRGLPYQGCFFTCNIRRDIFKRIMPLQITGSITAAWSPTSPAFGTTFKTLIKEIDSLFSLSTVVFRKHLGIKKKLTTFDRLE